MEGGKGMGGAWAEGGEVGEGEGGGVTGTGGGEGVHAAREQSGESGIGRVSSCFVPAEERTLQLLQLRVYTAV